MAEKRARAAGPKVHHVAPGDPVVFHGPDGREMPALAVIVAAPQGYPVLLPSSDQMDREGLLLACLQVLYQLRKQAEQSPLQKAGFIVPPGVLGRRPGEGPEGPVQ